VPLVEFRATEPALSAVEGVGILTPIQFLRLFRSFAPFVVEGSCLLLTCKILHLDTPRTLYK